MLSGVAFDDMEPLGLIELDSNLGDVEKPPILPAGKYQGEVVEVQKALSGKGNEYFAIAIKIPPAQIPAHLQDDFEDGATLYWNRQVVPNGKDRRSLYNLRKMIESFGLSSNTTAIDPNEWMGQEVGLVVKHTAFQGETRAEIGSLFAIDGGKVEPEKPAAKGRGSRGK
jgi:hypothetical protein